MALGKGDLTAAIAAASGQTKKVAAEVLDATLSAITAELKKGGQVTITGFGTFKVSHRKARVGVNPRNPSEKIQIKASNVASFKAGKGLKEAVNS
jgi:DNA-binding protein HU-beta